MFQKLFEVPVYSEDQEKIPFSRVNHNKYMVTDKHAYIGKYLVILVKFFHFSNSISVMD